MKKIDLTKDLSQGYYPGKSKVIFKSTDFFIVRTEVADSYNKLEFAIFYIISLDTLNAVEIAQCDTYSGVVWSLPLTDLMKIYDLDNDIVEVIEYEIARYHESGNLLSQAILSEQEVADDNYQGKCKVWVKYHYYDGTWNAPKDGYLADDDGDVIEFESYKKAQEYIKNQSSDNVYYLKHGEYAKPEYIIIKSIKTEEL
mgnify:CR=1 FL=1